jgi:flagellar biogenesis protein FliO
MVLAAGGAAAIAARRLGPRAPAGAVQVVGRVSLSPRHSVFLVKVGRRVLVVGAGPQGPPALIAELEDLPQEPPASQQVGGS